jgi:cell division protein FtsQ
MRRRGLPVAPPPVELLDLPLPGPEEGPFLRPRVRTRLRPRRRGAAHRVAVALQVTAALLVAGLGAWMAYQRVMASERFRVERVEVRGSHFLSEGEVRELLGPAVGERIFTIDIEALKARLRSSPWVQDATVSRTLPDTLRVEIRERVPVALAEVDQLYLMDGNGDLVDVYGPRTGAFDLPIVRGLQGLEEASRRERARRAGALLADLAELGQEISEVFVEPSGDLRVVLRGPGEVLLFGDPPYRPRFLTFLMLRRELAEKAPGAVHFDLRFRGRIYAKRPAAPPPAAAPETTGPRAAAGREPPSAPGAPPSLSAAEDTERGVIRDVPAASPPGRRVARDAPASRR